MALSLIALLCGDVLFAAGGDESPLPDQLESNLDMLSSSSGSNDDFYHPLLFASPRPLSPTLTPPLMRLSSVAPTCRTALKDNSLFTTRPDLYPPSSSKGVGKKRTASEVDDDSLDVYNSNEQVPLLDDIRFSNGMPLYIHPNEDDGVYGFNEVLQSLGYRDVFKDTKKYRIDG